MKKIEHMKRYMKRSFLLLPALLLACVLTASAEEVLPGANYGKIAIGANEVTMNGSYIGATGAELYIPVTETNHGSLVITGTATGSTKIVLNNFSATWDGTSIDLVEATAAGSAVDAFTMDATTAATSGKKAVLRTRLDGSKRTWFITEVGVTVDLKVFLEGPLKPDGKEMTNWLQVPDPNWENSALSEPVLPVNNPYGVAGVSCPSINDPVTLGLKVTDWVKVEVHKVSGGSLTLLESKALLLTTEGKIVDIHGNVPDFNPSSDAVMLVVRHRNHLPIMSPEIEQFNGSFERNFAQQSAFRYDTSDPNPMKQKYGVWCMWAGDLGKSGVEYYGDGTIDSSADKARHTAGLQSSVNYDAYLYPDVNLDGMIDSAADGTLILNNIGKGAYSPVIYY